MASVIEVAKYFLTKCDEEAGDTISNLKLQKLLYYAQGFHLAIFGDPLFDAPIEAWRHGPAVRSVYTRYADYGGQALPKPDDFDIATLDENTRDFLDEVYEVYGQYSAWRLREMTHEEPPWSDVWNPNGGPAEISHGSMRAYFSTLLE